MREHIVIVSKSENMRIQCKGLKKSRFHHSTGTRTVLPALLVNSR